MYLHRFGCFEFPIFLLIASIELSVLFNFDYLCFKDSEKEETDFKGTINSLSDKGPKYGIVDPKMGFCVKILGKTSKKLKPSNFRPKFRSEFFKECNLLFSIEF